MMEGGYALYRMPFSDSYTEIVQTDGSPEVLSSYGELDGRSGFVIAPFSISADCPLLLLRPDRMAYRRVSVTDEDVVTCCAGERGAGERADYSADFAECHRRLMSGEFRKVVLARRACEETETSMKPETLFMRACRLYPRMFVALVSTPQSGIWLTATPEYLLSGDGSLWHTMSLAGTVSLGGLCDDGRVTESDGGRLSGIEWDGKNMLEQRCVSEYIAGCLRRISTDVTEDGPYTARAGGVAHLRSDFTFTVSGSTGIGDIVSLLHPTPAVCGLPKQQTYRFIVGKEHSPRRYYSGFMGPLAVGGGTHLYVSLRCMQICGRRHFLYAGGGLLRDSVEQDEWNETEAKMDTMRRCLAIRRI